MELAAQNLGVLTHSHPAAFERSGIAVCYQCSFTTDEGRSSCPECSFPLIVQSELSPPGGFQIRDVLQRESLRMGAPPLPGVHSVPRKAQLLAEARKRIRQTARLSAQEQAASRADSQEQAARQSRGLGWNLLSVSCLAVGFGIVAAAVQNIL